MKTMKCSCSEELFYDEWYHCYECSSCGSCYNALGQKLAPKSQWKEEYDSEDYY